MEDVQNSPAPVALPIDRVGVKGLKLPLLVRDRAQGTQHTVANVDVSVDLPAAFKGTHMSRFVQALANWTEDLDYAGMKRLLEDVRERLNARRAHIVFHFPYFVQKNAPATACPGILPYECRLTGELPEDGKPSFLLEVTVPVMTVCPCSKAISREGAHSQRADVRMAVRMRGFCWIEDFIEIAEASGLPKSSAYPVSKAGLIMFTKCLAVEYAAEGIRANALYPGQILTDMNVKRYAREAAAKGCTPEETMRRAIATVPLGRIGTPRDVGLAAAFLVSDASAYMTGQALNVTGGQITEL